MLEIYQLEQLMAVAEYGTLSEAAQAVHLSQPSMSRSMKKLEDDLQVPLFDRRKNKIALNENGKLAVEHAKKVLDQLQQMEYHIRAFDRSRRTISIGACAPVPLVDGVEKLTGLFPTMSICSEMQEKEHLIQGLKDGTYQIIIVAEPVEDSELYCVKWGQEQIYFSLPPAHPLSGASGLHFKDLDGESILLFSQIGFWQEISRRNMPLSHFLMQQEWRDFKELMRASALPFFTSDIILQRDGRPENRAIIPILDQEATATFHCICMESQWSKFENFFSSFQKQR